MKLLPLPPFVTVMLYLLAGPASAENVQETWRVGEISSPTCVSVDSPGGSVWVAAGAELVRVRDDAQYTWRVTDYDWIYSVSGDVMAQGCWAAVTDSGGSLLVQITYDGRELQRLEGLSDARSVAVNYADRSFWAGDFGTSEVVHLAWNTDELWRGGSFPSPRSISVNPSDGSCWVAIDMAIVRLANDGTELLRLGGIDAQSVSVNASDGSCWTTDRQKAQVVHLAADGSELWRSPDLGAAPESVSVFPDDGSCWVAAGSYVIHLAENGAELWRGGDFTTARSVSVAPQGGCCIVADTENDEVARLDVCSAFDDIGCDTWARDDIVACQEAAIVAGYEDGCYHPEYAVTRDQMAVYISRALAGGDANVPEFTDIPSFPDVGARDWALHYVEYAVEQNVVGGYDDGTYHPEYQVTRDQMAVYVARALVAPTGDAAVIDHEAVFPIHFADVDESSWAYAHIQYCADAAVVRGYEDAYYHPEWTVTRDQMAVYIARAYHLYPS
jgi:hypothetical protein